MKKIFFGSLCILTYFLYSSERNSSPKISFDTRKKSDSIDLIDKKNRLVIDSDPITRVRKQSFGTSPEFMETKFAKEEHVTLNTFKKKDNK